MAGALTEVRVHGAAELERAFMQLRREVFLELREAIKQAGEAVRVQAEKRAGAEIANIGPKWERMRLGATVKGVYVAPFSKRHGGSPRPNLAPLLMGVMEEALADKGDEVLHEFEVLIEASAARQGFLIV